MRTVILLLAAFAVFSCGKKEETQDESTATADTAKVDTPKVGEGEDEHGCKTSAGFTWSEVQGECVRIFEKGTKLNPYGAQPGTIMPAFVLFKANKAEVFMQSGKVVLERKSEGEPFVKDDWQLIPWKGYVLKKGDKIMFTGQ